MRSHPYLHQRPGASGGNAKVAYAGLGAPATGLAAASCLGAGLLGAGVSASTSKPAIAAVFTDAVWFYVKAAKRLYALRREPPPTNDVKFDHLIAQLDRLITQNGAISRPAQSDSFPTPLSGPS